MDHHGGKRKRVVALIVIVLLVVLLVYQWPSLCAVQLDNERPQVSPPPVITQNPSTPPVVQVLQKYEVPPNCVGYDPLFTVPPREKIRNPSLTSFVPAGFANPYLASAPPFVFGSCEFGEEKSIEKQISMVVDPKVRCDKTTGLCRCPLKDEIFDGEKCIPKSKWVDVIETLKTKWEEVPLVKEDYLRSCMLRKLSSNHPDQMRTAELDALPDKELAKIWVEVAADDTFTMFYASTFRGKRVLDIGSGFARQSLKFAFYGADVWFFDVSAQNLRLIQRLAKIYDISDNVHVHSFTSLDGLRSTLKEIGQTFDAITAFGSLHHAPSEIIHEEVQILTDHLKIGGKWLQLAYPYDMWRFYDFSLFTSFGTFTDNGDGKSAPTPWAEWYHTKKLLAVFKPAKFIENWCGTVTFEFLWFDLTYLGKE